MIVLTYLEFYSGIGGWGYALEQACRSIAHGESDDGGLRLRAQLLAAYDHSDLCNAVFYHNHCYSSPSLPPPSSSSSDDSSKGRKKNNDRRKEFRANKKRENTKPRQTPIERLTLSELESHGADVWCMSPPCQPHTRQHTNQHLECKDARSQSFLHLCQLLCDMDGETLPKLILLENVVGFEKQSGRSNNDCIGGAGISGRVSSGNEDDAEDHNRRDVSSEAEATAPTKTTAGQDMEPKQQQSTSQQPQQKQHESCNDDAGSFDTWRRALSKRNYLVGHFHLDPTHVGIPNNRPRHYTVAYRRRQLSQNDAKREAKGDIQSGKMSSSRRLKNEDNPQHDEGWKIPQTLPFFLEGNNSEISCEDLFCRESLLSPPIIHQGKKMPPLSSLSSFLDVDLPPHDDASDPPPTTPTTRGAMPSTGKRELLRIPEKIRTRSSSWCFDIVSPYQGRVTSCFTHSYGKFIRGTGSILYTGPRTANTDDMARKNNDNLPSIDRFQLTPPQDRAYDGSWSNDLDWDLHMRYFSGTEIARLMGFPVAESPSIDSSIDASSSSSGGMGAVVSLNEKNDSIRRTFSFPKDCSMKQQWKLLGNSLNVHVAASVSEIGIRSVLNDPTRRLCDEEHNNENVSDRAEINSIA
ncbi:hypothetical protein ACHAW5_002917 [Stephanodiscus triporus]|uniref:Uncharacterized protein n=1 Tax=Stephanodiscus triporus TaxID=2934178 RepID=A0ABD3PWX9_9STRA